MNQIQRVEGKQCLALESLWREVFFEDSDKFTNYYYKVKAEKNIGLAVMQGDVNSVSEEKNGVDQEKGELIQSEQSYVAMMFLTPYQIQIEEKRQQLSYIIGVATKESFRHRGLMNQLLQESFRLMHEKRQAFTYLMPANPAIYTPYQFRYIYQKPVWRLKGELQIEEILLGKTIYCKEDSQISISCCKTDEELEAVAVFANQWLSDSMQVYAVRTKEYYEVQLQEIEAQNGGIITLKKDGQMIGFFLYAKEGDTVEIQEAMMLPEYKQHEPWYVQETKPIIMARIIHVEEMLSFVRSEIEQTIYLKIEDQLLKENNGIYQCCMKQEGSTVTRVDEQQVQRQLEKMNEQQKFMQLQAGTQKSASVTAELQAAEYIESTIKGKHIFEYKVEELVQLMFGVNGCEIPGFLPLNQIFLNEIV